MYVYDKEILQNEEAKKSYIQKYCSMGYNWCKNLYNKWHIILLTTKHV